jgi:hypothetical protein
LLTVALLQLLGCGGGTSVLYPLHARPALPLAVLEPDKIFLTCGDDYYCIAPEYLEDLRRFLIEQSAVIEKYEHNIELHNSSVN